MQSLLYRRVSGLSIVRINHRFIVRYKKDP